MKTPHTSNIYRLSDGSVRLSDHTTLDAPRTFAGIANSGKPFMYCDQRMVLDLTDIAYKTPMPILLDHDRSLKAGVGTLEVKDHVLMVSGSLLSNANGQDIATSADEGFPWEMSVDARPSHVEEIGAGVRCTVNGQELMGPLSILRRVTVREVSFTATGADKDTYAVVFSEHFQHPKEGKNMTLEEAVQQISDLKQQIANLEDELKKTKDDSEQEKLGFETQIADLKASAHKASIDALLSEAGFSRNDTQQFQGISEGTYKVLLLADKDGAAAMIADLKAANIPDYLLHETTPPSASSGSLKLSDNPLIINAQKRAKGEK